MQDGPIAATLTLGTDLVAEIQSEPDFPPSYLVNISAKMDAVRAGVRQVSAKAERLRERSGYASSKARFYAEFNDLVGKVDTLEAFLEGEKAARGEG